MTITPAVVTVAGPPPFPGAHMFHFGDSDPGIKVFQDQMLARGYFPIGTGNYGQNTLNMVESLQSQNGLTPNGEIGPNTWKLAWTGSYDPNAPIGFPNDPSCPSPQTLTATLVRSYPDATSLSGIDCSGDWAVAFPDELGNAFTAVFHRTGGSWGYVDRTGPCNSNEIPANMYEEACDSN